MSREPCAESSWRWQKKESQPVGMRAPWLLELSCISSGPGSCLPSPEILRAFHKRPMSGPGKLAPDRKLKAKPKTIHLFRLKIGQVMLPSVTWLFFEKQNTKCLMLAVDTSAPSGRFPFSQGSRRCEDSSLGSFTLSESFGGLGLFLFSHPILLSRLQPCEINS